MSEDNKRNKLNKPPTLESWAGWVACSYWLGLKQSDPEGHAHVPSSGSAMG